VESARGSRLRTRRTQLELYAVIVDREIARIVRCITEAISSGTGAARASSARRPLGQTSKHRRIDPGADVAELAEASRLVHETVAGPRPTPDRASTLGHC